MTRTFSANVEWDQETKLYAGIIPCMPGAHTQGATLDELQANLKEVLELCLEELQGDYIVIEKNHSARSLAISSTGLAPNRRLNSRLNCDALA